MHEIFRKTRRVAITADETEGNAHFPQIARESVTFAVRQADIEKNAIGTILFDGLLCLPKRRCDYDRFHTHGLENRFDIKGHQIFILNDDNPLWHHMFSSS